MRVVCIDAAQYPNEWPDDFLIEGNIYEVIRTEEAYGVDGRSNGLCYELKGGDGWGYQIKRFVPISEIDETEMVREDEIKQLLTQ